MNILNSYFSRVFTVSSYCLDHDSPAQGKQIVAWDTFKCVLIGAGLFSAIRFTRGKCHYMQYVKAIGRGSVFGLAYSFYFTNEKIEAFMVRSELGLPVID